VPPRKVGYVPSVPRFRPQVSLSPGFPGAIRLDITRALNVKKGALIGNVLAGADVKQMKGAMKREVSMAQRLRHLKTINSLGEKCKRMSDSNCQACLEDRQYLCLRSLLARFMRNPLLLEHKSIELSDLEGTLDVDAIGRIRSFVFSKLRKSKEGLTVRNASGAILLAQIIGQLDKSTFDSVGVLSPSTINEDLRERLTFLGGLTDKSVIFFDESILVKLLAEFEEQSHFDNVDPKLVYKVSAAKSGSLLERKKAPGFLRSGMR
jgi:hypothetical protein